MPLQLDVVHIHLLCPGHIQQLHTINDQALIQLVLELLRRSEIIRKYHTGVNSTMHDMDETINLIKRQEYSSGMWLITV